MGQTTTNYVLATGEVTGYSPPAGGTHTDLGGVEFVNAQPRRYHIPAGYYDTALKRWVFQLRDYLGTPRVTFTDVNGDGQIVAADDVLETRTLYPTRRNGAGAPLRSRAFGTTASVPGYATDDEDFTGHALRGGEVDRVHGLHDMRARYYIAGLGLFGGVDPLASSFPSYTPYHYVHNDPINLIDPTGMSAETVIITGSEADKATEELNKSSSLQITRDSETGKLSATGRAKTKADKTLKRAINDKKVTVKLDASNLLVRTDKNGDKSFANPGFYDGSEINADGSVTAEQGVNMEAAEAHAELAGETVGETLTHEVNEAYFGAKLDPGGDYNSGFSKAHNAAASRDRVREPGVIQEQDTRTRSVYLRSTKTGRRIKTGDY